MVNSGFRSTRITSCSSPSRRFSSREAAIPPKPPPRMSVRAVTRSAPRLGAVELELTQLDAPNLAGERLRQIGHELDQPRIGVGREALANEALDLVRELVR